jgi:hypothetical protein
MRSMTVGRRAGACALQAAMVLVLAGCLLMPGKFTSALDIRKDGTFTYGYTGEIHLLALSKLADMSSAAQANASFEPEPCVDDNYEEKVCTDEELATQKEEWEAERARAEERRKRDGESMKAVLGGIDPANPKAAEEFAQRLRRQAGWKKVEHKGDGLFVVDFSITGTLDHDFAFPTIERMAMVSPFVQLSSRQDGTVRMDGSAFGPAQAGGPYADMMKAAALSEGGKDGPDIPKIEGTFTLTTDGEILANNTDEGPTDHAAGQMLSWTVNAQSQAAPMALIKLAASAPAQGAGASESECRACPGGQARHSFGQAVRRLQLPDSSFS